ncbi:hypothetical protein M3Y97_00479100 [Aphelenchoides bicaudatus]|nr:hypothetical protein M3Y97_00479100 [Aphelenchoides bicaudatus]
MTASPPSSNSGLPAQNVENICKELQKIAQAKCELMDIDSRRKDLLGNLNEFQLHDQFISDTKKTIQELNEERDAHRQERS